MKIKLFILLTLFQINSLFAIDAPKLPWKQIIQGEFHVCGLDQTDRAWCWGSDYAGIGGESPSSEPKLVKGERRFQMISAGRRSTYALDFLGKVWMWGELSADLSLDIYRSPVVISADLRFASIYSGTSHACALDIEGEAWCIGDARLGDGNPYPSKEFQQVKSPVAFKSISPGKDQTCALDRANFVWCWGGFSDPNCEGSWDRPCETINAPRMVKGGIQFKEVAVGNFDVGCGISLTDLTYCWENIELPQLVLGAKRFHNIVLSSTACALDEVNQLWCWSPFQATAPQLVTNDQTFLKVFWDKHYGICAIDSEQVLWCFGSQFYSSVLFRQINKFSNGDAFEPWLSQFLGFNPYHSFVSGRRDYDCTCALDKDNKPWCWGYGYCLGQNHSEIVDSGKPLLVFGNHVFKTLTTGNRCMCGIDFNDKKWCWGAATGISNIPQEFETIDSRYSWSCR
jgi:hypothetical protein